MTDTLEVAFEVACSATHAFATWTERRGAWWPADHTISGGPDAIVLEGFVGGRIYERARGTEHEWGVVTTWQPPVRLGFRWHLGVGPERATDVDVAFVPLGEHATRVRIEQSGFERLGDVAADARARNRTGWESLALHLRAAIERGE